MMKCRKIKKVIKSKPTLEGAGVHLKRAFGFSEVPLLDPFLLLDDFRSGNPAHYLKGFPWHPHRGIETITYMLGGNVEHGDSMGNKGVIGPGDVQWMTAGSGIIHQEMPSGDARGAMYGFQLWANLPAATKMMDPRYRGFASVEIPEVAEPNGTRIMVIAGTVGGVTGPVRDVVTAPEYLDVTLAPGARLVHPTALGHTVFAYVFEGQASFCDQMNPYSYDAEGAGYLDLERSPWVQHEHLVLFDDGDHLVASAKDTPARFLLVSGKPLREPVAWYGPIVMNTREELRIAFEEYQNGTFIKKK